MAAVGAAPLSEQEQADLQRKLDTIVDKLIDKVNDPLAECEDAIIRINAKLGISQTASGFAQARTGKGQEIFNTIARAERMYQSLQYIETVILHHRSGASGLPDVPGMNKAADKKIKLSYTNLRISEDQGAYQEPRGWDYDKKVVHDENEKNYDRPDLMSHGKFTVAGLTTTAPMSNSVKNVHDELDGPITKKAEVQPWNTRYSITLEVTLPHQRWYTGETVKMTLEMWNQTTKKIRTLECTLVRRSVSYTFRNGERQGHSAKDQAVHSQTITPRGFPVPGRMRRRSEIAYKLPFKIDPSISKPDGSFEVQYWIYVRAVIPHHSGLSVAMGPLRVTEFSV